MQEVEQAKLRQPAEQGAGQARQQAQHAQLQAEQQHGFTARQAQAAQQRAGIETSTGEAVGRQRHGHASQQHGHQAGHVQVTFGLAQRAADLLVAIAGVLQPLVGSQARFDQVAIGLQRSAALWRTP